MITRSKKVRLEWKLNPSAFALVNKETIGENVRRLGSSVRLTATMVERSDEMKHLLPSVLGFDAESNSVNWTELVRKYWAGLTINVPPSGLHLEIGFNYDISDYRRSKFIQELMKTRSLKTEEEFVDYVEGVTNGKPNVTDDERYKYGVPIDVENYIFWRFASFSNEVANNIEDVNKSSNIRFYLYSDQDLKESREIAFKLTRDAMAKYLAILGNREEVLSILDVFQKDTTTVDDLGKDMMLDEIVKSTPKEFLVVANDPNLKIKARIERYISKGILRRLSNTSIITDGEDPSIIIGNNIGEAITFFSPENVKNKAVVAEYSARFKALNKN